MADGLLSRVAQALTRRGPNLGVVPEDDSKPDVGTIVSESGATFMVPSGWLNTIATNEDKILQRGGGQDLKLYEDLLDDDVAFSNFQQRRLAVISRDWEVAPGDEDDPRSVEAADHLRENLKAINFDRITDRMLFTVWFGYGVGEGMFEIGSDLKYRLADVVVPDRRWFGFTNEGELRFRPGYSIAGEKLPPNKFWVMRTGASHDFAFYGLGLAHWCYWPIWFKRNVIKFWALYLEKLGYPTVVGEQAEAWTDAEKASFLKALVAIGRDRAVKVPMDTLKGIKLMEAQRTTSGGSGYKDFVTEQNEALMRVILGQPGTSKATPQGVGGKQSEVHEDVKKEIVKADSDLVCGSFNQTFPVWLTRWNFGPDVAPPRVYRKLDDEDDIDTIADRDVKLDGIGIKRTEESIAETYGPGYEKVEPPPELAPGAPGMPPVAAANDDDKAKATAKRKAEFAAHDVAPLYVYRQLKNASGLQKWAKDNGIPNVMPAADMHVTVLHSREAVDWFEMADGYAFNEELRIPEGGPRKIKRFANGAIVLRFASDDLAWSHERKINRGASSDWPNYKPHITLGSDPDGTFDVEALEKAFTGELIFGPEMFEEAILSGPGLIRPIEFSADDEDAIAALARSLADATNPVMLEFGAILQTALEGISSPEAARVALLNAFEQMPAERMAAISGLPLVLERMTGEAGIE